VDSLTAIKSVPAIELPIVAGKVADTGTGKTNSQVDTIQLPKRMDSMGPDQTQDDA
jgi:hypothetical protein